MGITALSLKNKLMPDKKIKRPPNVNKSGDVAKVVGIKVYC